MGGLAWSHTSVHRHTRGEDRGWKSARDRIPRKTPPGKGRQGLGGPSEGSRVLGAGLQIRLRVPFTFDFQIHKNFLVSVCANIVWISVGVWRRETKPEGREIVLYGLIIIFM